MSRLIRAGSIRSFEREAVEKHKMPHFGDNTEVDKREHEILERRSAKLDGHARQRKNLTHLNAYAIDGEGAMFLDDAVSYDSKSGRVLVHIADPSAYFPDGSRDPIVRCALKKAKTIYLTGASLSMLPRRLNKYRFSLTEKKSRVPALTFGFKVRQDGSIRTSSVTVEPTYINVTRLSRKGANDIISSNKDLRRLRRVAGKLKDFREGVIKSRRRQTPPQDAKKSPAKDMVDELMIATKIAAGKYAKINGIRVLYLSAKSDCLDRSYPKAKPNRGNRRCKKLSVRAERHDGVGADAYVGVTSPLRDAVDLISHMQIKAYLESQKYPFSRRYLEKYGDRFQKLEGTIKRIENDVAKGCARRGYANCK